MHFVPSIPEKAETPGVKTSGLSFKLQIFKTENKEKGVFCFLGIQGLRQINTEE